MPLSYCDKVQHSSKLANSIFSQSMLLLHHVSSHMRPLTTLSPSEGGPRPKIQEDEVFEAIVERMTRGNEDITQLTVRSTQMSHVSVLCGIYTLNPTWYSLFFAKKNPSHALVVDEVCCPAMSSPINIPAISSSVRHRPSL